MKTFKDYLAEEPEYMIDKKVLENRIVALWNEIFPNSYLSVFKTSLGGTDMTSLFTGHLMKNTSEWINGISQNDPLRLSFSIKQSPMGIVIEYSANSYSVAPDQKHMAFGRHKIPLRKTTVKNIPALMKKMKEAFQKVKTEGQKAQKEGKFSVYDENQQTLISQKLR